MGNIIVVSKKRQEWPEVKIIFRGDGGFCRDRMLRWCDKHAIGYITGIAGNSRLQKASKNIQTQAVEQFVLRCKKLEQREKNNCKGRILS